MSRAFVLSVLVSSSVALVPMAWSAPLPPRFRVVPQIGHGAEIGAAALSPDGKLVATTSKDGSLKVWNARTGLLLRTLAVSETDFPAVAFVDDTKLVVSAPLARRRGEPPLSLWNAVEGTRIRGIGEARDVPRALSVSSDGRRAATLHADGDAVVWDVDKGASVRAIDAGADAVLALSGSGRHLATAATAVRIWGAESGALEKTLPTRLSRPRAIALSDDGAAVAIADSAAIVSWDVAAEKQRCRFDVTADEVALSPDARAAAVLDRAGMLRVWDLTKCVAHPAFAVGKKSRPRVAVGPLGARVFVSAEDGTVDAFTVATRARTKSWKAHASEVRALRVSSDGARVVTASLDEVSSWSAATGAKLGSASASIGFFGDVSAPRKGVVVLADGDAQAWTLVAGGAGKTREPSNARATPAPSSVFAAGDPAPGKLAGSRDGRRVLGARFGVLRAWDVASGTTVGRFVQPSGVLALALASDGKRAVTGADDAGVRLWDVDRGALLETRRHKNEVTAVAFADDGRMVSADGGNVAVWAPNGAPPRVCHYTYKNMAQALFPSKDASEIRVLGSTASMTWSTSCQLLHERRGASGGVAGGAISRDGRVVMGATGAGFSTWEWGADDDARRLGVDAASRSRAAVARLAFSKSGDTLLSWQKDKNDPNTVRAWDLGTLGVSTTYPEAHLSGDRIVRVRSEASLAPMDGADSRRAVPLPSGLSLLRVSSDGRRALGHLSRTERGADERTDVAVVVDLDSGGMTRLVADGFDGFNSSWPSGDLSADGKRALWGADDQPFRIGDTVTGRTLFSWPHLGPEAAHTRAALAPDASVFVEYGGSSIAWVRDARTGAKVRELDTQRKAVRGVAFSADGARMATVGDGAAIVWNAATGARVRAFTQPDVQSVDLSPDGARIAMADEKSTHVFDVETGALVRELAGAGELRFSRTGRRLATDKALWEVETGARVRAFEGFCHASRERIACTDEGERYVAQTADGREVARRLPSNAAWSFATPDARVGFLTVPRPMLVDAAGATRPLSGVTGPVAWAAISSDGSRLVSAGERAVGGAEIILWDTARAVAVRSVGGELPAAISVAMADDGARFVTSHVNGELHVWDATGNHVRTIATRERYVSPLAISRDGRRAIGAGRTANAPTAIHVWDLETGREERALAGHESVVGAVALSDDGRLAASGSDDGVVRLWSLGDEKSAGGTSIGLVAQGDDWLAFRDDGYFDASSRGGRLVAVADGADAFRVDQLAAWSNRPDLVLEKVGLGSDALRAHFAARHARRLQKLGLGDGAARFEGAPEAILEKIEQEGPRARVTFRVKSAAELARYNVWANDVPIFGAAGKETSGTEQRITETIELTPGKNRIEVGARDRSGVESLRPMREVDGGDGGGKGDLLIVAFGVSRYKNGRFDLRYPRKDVLDLAEVLRHSKGTFENVVTHTFVDDQATVANVKRARALFANAKTNDTVLLVLAGHGLHTRDAAADYYFATHEVEPARLPETAARFETIEDILQGIRPRRKLFLLDTCESGELDDPDSPAPTLVPGLTPRTTRALVLDGRPAATPQPGARAAMPSRDRYIYNDLARRSGAIVLSSSRGGELSWENDELKNGVFTKAVLWAVAERTGGRQNPTVDRDNVTVRISLPVVREAAALAVLTRDDPTAPVAPAAPKPPSVRPPAACGCRVQGAGESPGPAVLAVVLVGLALSGRRLTRPRRAV